MTPKQIKKQEEFIAWAKTRLMDTSFRYMEERTRDFDSAYTAHAWWGWCAARGLKERKRG